MKTAGLTWISFMMAAKREDLAAKALIRFMALSKFLTNSVYILRNGAHDFMMSPANETIRVNPY